MMAPGFYIGNRGFPSNSRCSRCGKGGRELSLNFVNGGTLKKKDNKKNQVLIDYQAWVRQMWSGKKKGLDLTDLFVMSTGLGGESGEVLEILKKGVRGNKRIDVTHLTEELGDVMYYLVMICNYHNISVVDVMESNIEKIDIRYAHLKVKR